MVPVIHVLFSTDKVAGAVIRERGDCCMSQNLNKKTQNLNGQFHKARYDGKIIQVRIMCLIGQLILLRNNAGSVAEAMTRHN